MSPDRTATTTAVAPVSTRRAAPDRGAPEQDFAALLETQSATPPTRDRPAADAGRRDPARDRPADDAGRRDPARDRPAADAGRRDPARNRPADDAGRRDPAAHAPSRSEQGDVVTDPRKPQGD